MPMEVVIDGDRFSTLSEFYDEAQREICPAFEDFGRNLDAFNDILRGGFGLFALGEPITLVWEHSAKSRADLGPAETLRYLSEKASWCHPSHLPSIKREMALLRSGRGTTLFEILVDLIRGHEHVSLSLR